MAQKKPGPIRRRRDGKGVYPRVEKQAVEGNGHKLRPVARRVHTGETAPCWSVEGEPWDDNCCVQEAVSFL